METFTKYGRFEVKDGQHGWAVVKYEGFKMFVNALVVSENTPNYCDIVAVNEVISKALHNAQRTLIAEEIFDILIEAFGISKVTCDSIELTRVEAELAREREKVVAVEYKGYKSSFSDYVTSYRNMRGHFLEDDKSIHVCGFEGNHILVQIESCGAVKKLKMHFNNKGVFFNAKGKRIYIDYVA